MQPPKKPDTSTSKQVQRTPPPPAPGWGGWASSLLSSGISRVWGQEKPAEETSLDKRGVGEPTQFDSQAYKADFAEKAKSSPEQFVKFFQIEVDNLVHNELNDKTQNKDFLKAKVLALAEVAEKFSSLVTPEKLSKENFRTLLQSILKFNDVCFSEKNAHDNFKGQADLEVTGDFFASGALKGPLAYIESFAGDVDSQFWKEIQDAVKTYYKHTGDGNRDKWLRIMTYDIDLAIQRVIDSSSKASPAFPAKTEVPQIPHVPQAPAAKEPQGIEALLANEILLKQAVTDVKKEGPNALGKALDLINACCKHLNNNRADTTLVKKYSPKLLELLEAMVAWDQQENLINSLQDTTKLNSLALTLGNIDSVYDLLLSDNKYMNILQFMTKLHISLSKNENLLSRETLSAWLKGILCLFTNECYLTITPHLEAAQNLNDTIRNIIKKYESNPKYTDIFQSLHNELLAAQKSFRAARAAYIAKEKAETEADDQSKGLLY